MAPRISASGERAAVMSDAQKVRDVERAREVAQQHETMQKEAQRIAKIAAMPAPRALASTQGGWPGSDVQPRLVDRFAQ